MKLNALVFIHCGIVIDPAWLNDFSPFNIMQNSTSPYALLTDLHFEVKHQPDCQ